MKSFAALHPGKCTSTRLQSGDRRHTVSRWTRDHSRPLNGATACWISVLIWYCLAVTSALCAPYPKEGKLTKWTQPDGTLLTVKVIGDEFYGRTTTKDGYTVIFDPVSKGYYYATLAADGTTLISTGVLAHQPPPGILP